MTDWQTKFQTMRKEFFARALQRLERTETLLGQLREAPGDRRLLESLRKDVHWLAGTGGTYKLAALSEIGDEAELICDEALEDGVALKESDIVQLKALIGQSRSLIEKETSGGAV